MFSKLAGMVLLSAAAVLLSLSPELSAAEPEGAEHFWPQWRGPLANGVAPHATPAIEWGEETNLRWKVRVPGLGHSTPVVWGDVVFVQTAVETDRKAETPSQGQPDNPHGRRGPPMRKTEFLQQFKLLALSRRDGAVLWEKVLNEAAPHERTHVDGSWASGSPITDGEHVYAFFGSWGLHCLTMKGDLVWSRDLGKMRTKMEFGEGVSPVLHGGKLVVQWDHEGPSFLVALDKATGKELWRTARDEATSWATPLVVKAGGGFQVVTSASKLVRAYDLDTGKQLWQLSGMTMNVIPSPVAGDGLVHLASGFRGTALLTVRIEEALGDITGTEAIAWDKPGDTPYVPSPLLVGGNLFFLKGNDPILTCLDAKTGQDKFRARKLEGLKGDYASPVWAAGKVYVTGRNGATAVLEDGGDFALLKVNKLEGDFTASCAPVGADLIMRSYEAVYCLSEKK